MAENTLITKAEVLTLWPQLDFNTNEDKVNSYILRSQQGDLKPLIGPALYYDIVTNPTTTENAKLLEGGTYTYNGNTIFFSGVKDYLCASTYSRILNNISTNAGRASVVQKDTEQSQAVPENLVKQKSREVDSESIRLQAEVVQFLDQKAADYPLWNQRESDAAQRKTSFRISRVPRHKQR